MPAKEINRRGLTVALFNRTRQLILFVCASMMIQAAAADTTSYSVHTYVYKTTGTGELKLDVFQPAKADVGAGSLPVIILFHGGNWISGERNYLAWQCRYFASHGIVAVTAAYRFMSAGDGGKKICIMDVKTAVRWVKKHAAELQVDNNKIILGGGSAGAHLATMAALNTTINDPSDDTTVSTNANALVLFNPAYNVDEDPDLQPFACSPAQVPPTILFFGNKDKWKPAADKFFNGVKKNGNSEMWIAEGQAHAFFNKDPWNLATCVQAHIFLYELGLMNRRVSASATSILVRQDQ